MSAATGVPAAIAAYAHALDAGRTDELVALFTADGVSDIVGIARYAGHDELRAGYAAMVPDGPQLHLVSNTVLTSYDDDAASAVSDLGFFARDESGWALRMVGRYDDTFVRDGDAWRFSERVLTFT